MILVIVLIAVILLLALAVVVLYNRLVRLQPLGELMGAGRRPACGAATT